MEQIPHLAMYCQENKDLFPNSVSMYILPMVVRYLNDPTNQVSTASYTPCNEVAGQILCRTIT